MVYVGEQEVYAQESETKRQGKKVVQVSGAELRRRLRANEEIPGRHSEEGKQQVLQLNILRRSHALVFCRSWFRMRCMHVGINFWCLVSFRVMLVVELVTA